MTSPSEILSESYNCPELRINTNADAFDLHDSLDSKLASLESTAGLLSYHFENEQNVNVKAAIDAVDSVSQLVTECRAFMRALLDKYGITANEESIQQSIHHAATLLAKGANDVKIKLRHFALCSFFVGAVVGALVVFFAV